MSLVKCKACGHSVSKKAEKCPNCGEPMKRKSVGCLGAVAILAVALVIGSIISTGGGSGSKEPAKPKTAAELRADKIQNQFSPWDGSHRQLEAVLKKSLKDPDSYEHIETRFKDNGDEGIYVVMKYRAKNSFGGYVVNSVAATYSIDGVLLSGPASLD